MKLKLYNPLKSMALTQGFGFGGTDPSMLSVYQKMGLGNGHNGLDYWAIDGTPVYATHDGRVTFAGYDGSGGLGIVIRTNEEYEYGEGKSYFKTIYWHLKKDSLVVTGGQQVKRGDKIGEADNTGMSTGSHLHFGLKPIARGENDWTWFNTEQNNGMLGAIDPTPYFLKFQQEMKLGQTYNIIREMQEFLKQLGFFKARATGFYGLMTAKAVLEFQKKYCNLSVYEQYILAGTKAGPKTLDALNQQWDYK